MKESYAKIVFKNMTISKDKVAHSLEDALYLDFIKHIYKTGTDSQKKLAREVLKTQEIAIDRWDTINI